MTRVGFLQSVIRHKDCKLRGRADTIRRLLDEMAYRECVAGCESDDFDEAIKQRDWSRKSLHKAKAKSRGRANTIRQLLEEIGAHELRADAIRAWFRGELTTDPAPKPWFCMWCAEPIVGNRSDAAAHVQQCQSNPLVQERDRLRNNLDLYHQERQEIRDLIPGACEDNDLTLVDCVRRLVEENKRLRATGGVE